jgi:predicted TIM-barrel fold metal-dependent hydrolase
MMERHPTTRRRFLADAAALGAASGLVLPARSAEPKHSPVVASPTLIDTHVYVGDWPHAYLPAAEPRSLAELLRANNVRQAWVGSFDGLFHKDIAGANERLLEVCAGQAQDLLVPFGSVNPTLPNWEDDIRRCAEDLKMPGIRLHPNYHGYTLGDRCFAHLLRRVAEHKLLVQLVAALDDTPRKWLSPRLKHVDLKPLPPAAAKIADLRVLVSGAVVADEALLGEFAKIKSIYFELPQRDVAAITRILDHIPTQRIVLGSAAPLHSIGATMGTRQHASDDHSIQQSIATKNAMRILNGSD